VRSRYGVLLLAIAVLAVALSVLARLAPHGSRTERAAGAPVSAPVVSLALDACDSTVVPESAQVPKDHRVRLTVTNRGRTPARLVLSGYEDRLSIPPLPPGAAWSGEFLADRPGEDFAWILAGQPAGRLTVTGSHLVEGHQ
jgi:hypothetical protein